jgi:hypothetical protein
VNEFRVVVNNKIDDLNMEEWYFTLEGRVFILDRYYFWVRASKRHKFNTTIHYNRYDKRTNNIEENRIEISNEIQEMIKEVVHKNLIVSKWDESRSINKHYEAIIKI